MSEHRWSGWPGAYCLDCGAEDRREICAAEHPWPDCPDCSNKVVHCKRDSFDIYVGRPSKWGNPFSHKPGTMAQFMAKDRKEAILKYEGWLEFQPELMAALPELKGKILGCWCAPERCHAEVLARRSCNTCCGTGVKAGCGSPDCDNQPCLEPGSNRNNPYVKA